MEKVGERENAQYNSHEFIFQYVTDKIFFKRCITRESYMGNKKIANPNDTNFYEYQSHYQ